MKNIFSPQDSEQFIERINQLRPDKQPQWGKMSVAQMLAHCNVTYEMMYEDKHKKPGMILRWVLKSFVKPKVVNEEMYPKNNRTAPQFIISDERDFEKEKSRLIAYIRKTQQLGAAHFEGRESHSFGALTSTEWNNMCAKHLEHHLGQFGV
ncbi:MAG TPA: DUF1569 domain-containing protein [Catalimonadaceae bacterium]|mgnify:CR=1 FL=1|nr:DUF1569 domain-containing protein [Catalimonadaceae bacterium]